MVNGKTSHIVALGLVVSVLATVVSFVVLTLAGKDIPEALIAIGSGAIGALATLMNSKPSE